MHISNNKYRLAPLTKDNIIPASQLLADMFLSTNQVWKALKISNQQAFDFMLAKTEELLKWQQELRDEGLLAKDAAVNFVYLNDQNEIIGVNTNCELSHHFNKVSQVKNSKFDSLENYTQDIEHKIDPEDMVPGKNIYGFFTAIKPKSGLGVFSSFYLDISVYFYNQGFKYLYGRVSSPKALENVLRNGNQIIAQFEGVENGKKVKFWWVRWLFRPLHVHLQEAKKAKEVAKL